MAGAGWREWTAGEQLTDAKMQQFLQDQAVMRFANASARTTALNGVVSEGMITYLDDLNVVEVWDGSQWTELTGDPDIFTQGTAGQYLASLGTAGVEWSDIDGAAPDTLGLVYGRPGQFSLVSPTLADTSYSVALGPNASGGTARPNASLIGNTTIGGNTGFSVTTGHNNVLVGGEAGLNVTTGSKNVIVGTSAGQTLSTSDSNVFIGHGAGFNATSGANTAVGLDTLRVATGGSNTAIGQTALTGVTTGLGNVGVGGGAGASITTGIINTCLGPDAGSFFSGIAIGSGQNNTLIGFNAAPSTANVSNQITLGNSSITSLRCQVTTISALSDVRDKTNIQDSPYGLELVNKLRPVTFDWNMRDGARVDAPDLGFIAQELAEVEDSYDAQTLALTLRDNPDRLEATPGRLIPILVKAIQELTARVEELENAR